MSDNDTATDTGEEHDGEVSNLILYAPFSAIFIRCRRGATVLPSDLYCTPSMLLLVKLQWPSLIISSQSCGSLSAGSMPYRQSALVIEHLIDVSVAVHRRHALSRFKYQSFSTSSRTLRENGGLGRRSAGRSRSANSPTSVRQKVKAPAGHNQGSGNIFARTMCNGGRGAETREGRHYGQLADTRASLSFSSRVNAAVETSD